MHSLFPPSIFWKIYEYLLFRTGLFCLRLRCWREITWPDSLTSVVDTGGASGGESEWEYYTESSEEEQAVVPSSPAPPTAQQTKESARTETKTVQTSNNILQPTLTKAETELPAQKSFVQLKQSAPPPRPTITVKDQKAPAQPVTAKSQKTPLVENAKSKVVSSKETSVEANKPKFMPEVLKPKPPSNVAKAKPVPEPPEFKVATENPEPPEPPKPLSVTEASKPKAIPEVSKPKLVSDKHSISISALSQGESKKATSASLDVNKNISKVELVTVTSKPTKIVENKNNVQKPDSETANRNNSKPNDDKASVTENKSKAAAADSEASIKGNKRGEAGRDGDAPTKSKAKTEAKSQAAALEKESKSSAGAGGKKINNDISDAVVTKNDVNRQKIAVQQDASKAVKIAEKQTENGHKISTENKLISQKQNGNVLSNAKHPRENSELIISAFCSPPDKDKVKTKSDTDSPSRTSSPENQMPATSLDRLPTPLKNMFASNISPKLSPENAPKWYNNTPVEDPNFVNPNQVMAEMKKDLSKQATKVSKEEATLIKVSDQAAKPWYDDEDDDMRELLQKRPTILKEVDQV